MVEYLIVYSGIYPSKLMEILNIRALEGWRVVCSYNDGIIMVREIQSLPLEETINVTSTHVPLDI